VRSGTEPATVVKTYSCVDGFIHMIDGHLLPISSLDEVLEANGIGEQAEVLRKSIQFESKKKFTLFLTSTPSINDVINSSGPKKRKAKLAESINNQIATGLHFEKSLTKMGKKKENLTSQGDKSIKISRASGILLVNKRPIVKADIMFDGGVLHILDDNVVNTAKKPRASAIDNYGAAQVIQVNPSHFKKPNKS